MVLPITNIDTAVCDLECKYGCAFSDYIKSLFYCDKAASKAALKEMTTIKKALTLLYNYNSDLGCYSINEISFYISQKGLA